MVVYVELVWLLNFFIDWMILLLTQYVTKEPVKRFRLLFAAVFGSLIVPFSILFPSFPHELWFVKILYSFFIILIGFGYHSIAKLFRVIFMFYLMTFSIGGGLLAVHFLFQSNQHLSSVELSNGSIDALFVLLCFPVIWYFTRNRMDKHKLQSLHDDFIYQVTIKWNDKNVSFDGYLDSGNHLVDPLTQKPVIVIDESVLSEFFTVIELERLRGLKEQLLSGQQDDDLSKMFSIIPYQGVNGMTDFMIGFKPDLFMITTDKGIYKTKRVLIGIQFGRLVADNSYQCLLHPKLIQHVG
ncbi:stage II sporulation protein GA (sporulation sigma-E factor processing peptidase) [Gracilibacillus halotolerans]|uniref:Sporulation sigma-E factor-processing peptidase n=1 Tax=Gracilibacillus halotolerans TaxID=74386 RepID=A0A841RH46_9BACI|nr:stage II sporulation protein GA (sporulation sigma-E factor processing peptidase) [Gracilibacillus halotolerans]